MSAMSALMWAGGVAGALLAIGTLVRYLIRRTVRAAVWAAAAARLPSVVEQLAGTVQTLTISVDQLIAAVDDLKRSDHVVSR